MENSTEAGTASAGSGVPADWPACTLEQARARLCAPGTRFEMETVRVRGIETRVWKHALGSLAELARHARSHGDRTFLIHEDERISYEAWFRATRALAAELAAMGITKGDRVGLAMRNVPEWPVAFFAIASVGAIVVPLNAWWTGAELAYGLSNSGAKALICDADRWDRIAPEAADLADLAQVLVSRCDTLPAAPARHLEDLIGTPDRYADLPDGDLPDIDIDTDDAATIFYTSGTTGNPKGALGTHRNILTNILSSSYAAARACLRRGETPPAPTPKVMLTVIPLFHVTACNAGLMGGMFAGHAFVFMAKWDVVKAYQIIEREKVNMTGGVPTIAWQLIEHPDRDKYDLSSLETVSYGGAPSAPDLVRKIRDVFGALPGNGWGMTETAGTATSHSAEDYLNRPDSCGPPVAVIDLRIMSPEGDRELPVGEVGELWARGPQIVAGYWNNPEATAETFQDGWIRTGDLARLDEEGFCFIVDRAKDIIIRGGENIYSTEVENVLYEHPAVTDAALVGIPHRTLGEEPAAVVHLAPGASASEDELKAWVRERLAIFKTPVSILFTDETLPRNANGKIIKTDLRPLFANEQA